MNIEEALNIEIKQTEKKRCTVCSTVPREDLKQVAQAIAAGLSFEAGGRALAAAGYDVSVSSLKRHLAKNH